jgi:tetratricopeptide (TPR) repeat protein
MKKIILFLFLAFLFTGVVSAQNDDFVNAIMKAKKNLHTAMNNFEEKDLLKVRGEFERILQLKKNMWIVNYWIAYIDYSIATSAMEEKSRDNDKVKKYTESALALTDKSMEEKDDFADTYVLRMSLNFNRWFYESDKMEDILSGTNQAEEKVKKLDASNPRYHFMKGLSMLYTPESFGGGTDNALKSFGKAYDVFQTRKEAEEYYPDWGYDMTCGFLSLTYMKRDNEGDLDKAKIYLDKGLEINPNSGFLLNTVTKQYEEKTKKN